MTGDIVDDHKLPVKFAERIRLGRGERKKSRPAIAFLPSDDASRVTDANVVVEGASRPRTGSRHRTSSTTRARRASPRLQFQP